MTPGARRRVDRAKPRHLKRAGTPQATYPTFTLGVDHHYPTAARPITAANYSRYIGRVGALAVALGVGAAMSTGHGLGVAHADTDTTSGDSPSPESPSTSTQSTDTTTPTPSDNSSDSNTKTSEPDPADKDDDGMQVGNSGGLNNSTNDAGQATDENEDEDEDETTSTPATPTTEPEILPTEPVVIEETPEDVTTEEPETSSAPTQSVDNDSPSGTTPTADPEPADTDSSATETTPSETTEAPEALLSAAAHDAHSSTPDALSSTTTVPPTVNPLHSVLAPPRTVVELASAFVSALLAPILAPWPAPCEPPLLWALLSWVRREVQRTFFNRTPIVVPEEITLVLGPGQESNPIPFHVHDFDGDGLKYYVPTQGVPGGPRYGSVTVDQATGTYTYTPDEGFTGVDEFRVTASDAHTRFHMHGLLGFLRPHWGHTDTARIRVTVVAPGVQAPVVANDYYQTEQGNPLTGNVLANDSDPNGETLTAAPLTEPQYGKLTLGPDGSFHYEPDPDYHGEDAFSYTASNSELSSNARVEIVITPVNRAPVGVDDSYTTDEDTPVGGNVLDNDSDPDGDGMTAILDTPASHGSVHLNGDGSFTYTPHTNFVGEDTFSYVTHDGTQAGASTLVRITVTAVNDDPVATPDSYTIGEDSTLHGNVLTNDTDADGDPLTATVVSGPSHGGLQWNSNGSFTYTPNENYAGTDSFTYAVSDGQGGTATGAVSITVDAVNDAPVAANDSFTVDENGTLQGNVLTNDHDVDSTTLTPTVFSPPSHGTLTMNADGSFTYTPAANFHGTDTFSYTVSDGVATSAPALVVISVTPVDSAPVAVGDNFTIVEDSVLSGNVLSNDTDADRDSLIAELVSGPANGTLTFNADGTFTYKPAKNFAGTDSFTYTASDGTSDSGIGTVTITVTAVNDAPVAEDDFYSTQEDQSVSGNVLDNDSDVDDDTLTVSLDEPPAHGTVTLNPDGTFTYTPPPDFHGVDFFSYTTTDEVATTTPTLVIITVTPVNDPPVAVDDEYTINEDTVLTGNVLSNDSDLERNNLTAHLVDGPANGTVTLNPDGTFTYTPETGYNGPDSFTYYAFDGSASSEVSTVHITVRDVNYAPVANNDAVSTNEDTTRTGNVLTNDTDADGDQLTAQLVSGPAHGTLTLNPDGSYSYTPNANFNGTDTFTYTASDSFATSNTATVTITVIAVNDPPVPGSDSYTIGEDTTLTGNVLANDSDPEADLLAVELLSDAANGTLTLNADGSFSYTPTLNFNGTDTFTYTVSDGRGGTAVGTVSITVEASNDPPVASDDSVATDEDDAFTGSFPVSDVDSSTITSSVVAGPANGQLVLHDDGTYTYTPNADFNGTDSFTYRATDAEGAISTVATISITVRPVNDAPVASDDSIVTDEDAPYSGSVSTSDIDGDTVTTVVDQDVEHGTLVLNDDGTFTYTPDENFYGTDSFTYRASDGNGGLTTGTVSITVEAVNDAATPVDDAYSTDEDTPLTIPAAGGVLGNDTDVEGDPLEAILVSGPANGALTLNDDGSFTYTPDENFNGTDTFTYKVNDGTEDSDTATVTITVNAVNDAPTTTDTAVTFDEDDTYNGAVPISDIDENDTATVTLGQNVTNGTLVLNTDGTYTYTPTTDFNGTDSFTYTVTDSQGATTTGTVTITVNAVNDAPVTNDTAVTVDEDNTYNGAVPISDIDENDTATVTLGQNVTNGTLVLNPNGTYTYTPTTDFNGTDSFTYTVTDSQGATTTGTATITVNAVNDAPVTNDTAVEVDEDSPYNGSIPVSDVDGDTTTVTVDQNVTNGTLVLNPNGTYTYTPNADFNGTDSFTYTVTDGNGGTATGTVTITVADINDPPVANDDAVETDEDQEYVGTLPVSDTEDDTLTTNVVTGPSNGQLVVRPDGTYTYTPNADFNGTDSFTYTVTDSDGATSGEATITITVEAQNDAPIAGDDTFTIDEDHRIDADVPVSDVDDDPLTVELVDGPANGTLTLNPDGTFTYTPNANFNGTDSFTYTVNDGTVTSEIATITIEINEVNDPPIATNDSYSVGEDGQLTGNVLDNDTDVDRDPVTATLVSGPANGTLTLNPDGSFTYTPNANFTGTDSFTYRTSDGELDSNTALVTIAVTEVNDPPVANDDSFTTDEDRQLTGNVLDNDTDVDGNPLGAVVVSGPSNGTLTLNADGTFTYTPNANFSGTDTFTYAASDGSLSDTALVTISVTAVNDPPVATNDSFTGTEDNPVSGNVLTNDVDADNDTLTAAVVSGPSRGTLNFNPDGTFTYTPNANYSGTDSFTYSVSDGQGGTATGTVTITVSAVNDAPVANNDSFVTDEDSPLAGNVLDNDTDIEGNTLTAAVVSGPSRGTLNFNADGSFTYTPNANYSGTDSFTYSVSDGQGGIATGTVTLTVTAVNDPPVANHDSYTVAEDGELQGNVLDNDSDVDGDELKAVLVSGPSSGSLTLNEDGTFTYRPNANFSGTDTFFYRVNDGTVNSSTRSVTISVTAVNDPPVAGNDSVTTNEDTAYSGNVLSNDSDVDGNPLTATLRTQATNGSVTLNSNGTFTYTPHENWSGADSFTYTVSDGQGGTAIGTVSITVTPVNDRPVAGNDGFSVDEDGVLTGNVLTNDTDVDGTIQSASVVTGPTRGTLEFNSTTGAFTYRPNANYSGTDSFTYTVTDGSLTSEVATVTITVTAVNDAPVANDASHTINQATNGQPTVFNGSLSGSDVDSSSLTYTITNPPQNGTISNFNPSTGTFTFTPSGPGTASFTYTVSDGSATSNTATVSFTIVDNVAPTAADVQTVDGGGINGLIQQGDTITYTFSEPIDPNSIMVGWNGGATDVTIRAYDGNILLGLLGGSNDTLQVYNAANNAMLALGTIDLGRTDYVTGLLGGTITYGRPGESVRSTMTMTSPTAITITLGTYDSVLLGAVRNPASGTGTMVWTPSAGPKDFAGNALVTGQHVVIASESGTADRDF